MIELFFSSKRMKTMKLINITTSKWYDEQNLYNPASIKMFTCVNKVRSLQKYKLAM